MSEERAKIVLAESRKTSLFNLKNARPDTGLNAVAKPFYRKPAMRILTSVELSNSALFKKSLSAVSEGQNIFESRSLRLRL